MNYKTLYQKVQTVSENYKRDLRNAKWGRCQYCETPLFDPMNPAAHAHMDFCGLYCENASKGKGVPSMISK